MRIRSLIGVTLLAVPVWSVATLAPASAPALLPFAGAPAASAQTSAPTAAAPAAPAATSTPGQWPGSVTAPREDAARSGFLGSALQSDQTNGLNPRFALVPGGILLAMVVLGIFTVRLARQERR